MRRAAIVLGLAAASLAACGAPVEQMSLVPEAVAPTPIEPRAPSPVPGYDWHLSRHEGHSSLAFGVAETDDVALSLGCEDGSGRVSLFTDVETGAPREIHLESGGESERLAADSEPSLLSGGQILSAEAGIDLPVFQRFRRNGWLAAWRGGERETYAPHPGSEARIEGFFAACG